MSITINGATNTLTAASGLTIAGNTAVTGTLSASGNITGDANLLLPAATAAIGFGVGATEQIYRVGNALRAYVNSADVATFSSTGLAVTGTLSASDNFTLTTGKVIYLNNPSNNSAISIYNNGGSGQSSLIIGSGATWGTWGSTGLTVTGAVSATGVTTLTGGALIPADAVVYGNALTGPNYNRLKIYNAGTGDMEYFASFPTGSHKFYQGGSDTLIGTFSSTALTLGTGVNLVMAPSYIEGSEMTAPAAPAANGFRIFAEDNGAGKTRLMVQFATGAAQQLAIEP